MSKKLLDRIKNKNTEVHPELLPGEIFLTNVWEDSAFGFGQIGWETKRKGKYTYDASGKLLSDACPVFVKEEEILNEPD